MVILLDLCIPNNRLIRIHRLLVHMFQNNNLLHHSHILLYSILLHNHTIHLPLQTYQRECKSKEEYRVSMLERLLVVMKDKMMVREMVILSHQSGK